MPARPGRVVEVCRAFSVGCVGLPDDCRIVILIVANLAASAPGAVSAMRAASRVRCTGSKAVPVRTR